MEAAEMIVTVAIALLSAACGVLGIMLQRKTERMKIAERQLSERKSQVYADLAELFYDALRNVKQDRPFDAVAAQETIYRLKKEILVFGSDDVFRRLNDWLCATGEPGKGDRQMLCFMELLLALRRDIYNGRTSVTKKEILTHLLQNEREAEAWLQTWSAEENSRNRR